MLSVVVLVLAVFHAATEVGAIIPLPCATTESLSSRTCCPTPNITGATQCGANLGRGSCQAVLLSRDGNETDVSLCSTFKERACATSDTEGTTAESAATGTTTEPTARKRPSASADRSVIWTILNTALHCEPLRTAGHATWSQQHARRILKRYIIP